MIKKMNDYKYGYFCTVGTYLTWGFVPLFWKQLQQIPAIEILSHRMIWSYVFYSLILSIKAKKIQLTSRIPKLDFFYFVAASVLIMANWGLYIWAVNSGHIIESSLGYFLNPLVNVLLGVGLLKESLSFGKKCAVALATLGVAVITYDAGQWPWIAVLLALTFGLYGLMKKKIQSPGLAGNQFETILLLPLAFIILFFNHSSAESYTVFNTTLLILGGVITGVPLLLFAEAAKNLKLSTLGFFQYISPTLQFLTGWLIYHEALSTYRMAGFVLIWIGLLCIAAETLYQKNKR